LLVALAAVESRQRSPARLLTLVYVGILQPGENHVAWTPSEKSPTVNGSAESICKIRTNRQAFFLAEEISQTSLPH